MVNRNLTVEDARIAFRNFAGEATKFKREGSREFCIIFDNETGVDLLDQGWNLRQLRPRDEEELPAYCLSVSIQFGKFPPDIFLIKGKTKVRLDEDSIATLDHAEIETCDVVVRPYNWEVNGKTGVKAYAKTMYVVLREDTFASKYDFDDEMPF